MQNHLCRFLAVVWLCGCSSAVGNAADAEVLDSNLDASPEATVDGVIRDAVASDQAVNDSAVDVAASDASTVNACVALHETHQSECGSTCREDFRVSVPYANLTQDQLRARTDAVVITATMSATDAQTLLNDANKHVFLITPGDYSAWARISLTRAGTASSPRLMRPLLASGEPRAQFSFTAVDVLAPYWTMDGMLFEHRSLRWDGADHAILNNCELRDLANHGIRVFDTSNAVVQNSSFHGKDEGTADIGGVGIWARVGHLSEDNRIINNEFYDLTDGIGMPMEGGGGEAPGTVIAHNHFYLTSAVIRNGLACAENAIDVKMGTTTETRPVRIFANVMHGFRPTDTTCGGTGSTGVAIVLHRNARNVHIEHNTICDCPLGITVGAARTDEPTERVEDNEITSNVVTGMIGYDGIRDEGPTGGTTVHVDGTCFTIAVTRTRIFNNTCRMTPVLMWVKPGETPMSGGNVFAP